MTIAIYPWEDIDMAVREQAEAEIWSDEEHDVWLEALTADQLTAINGADPMYERWVAEGAPSVARQWTLLDGDVDVLPDWEREDYVGI